MFRTIRITALLCILAIFQNAEGLDIVVIDNLTNSPIAYESFTQEKMALMFQTGPGTSMISSLTFLLAFNQSVTAKFTPAIYAVDSNNLPTGNALVTGSILTYTGSGVPILATYNSSMLGSSLTSFVLQGSNKYALVVSDSGSGLQSGWGVSDSPNYTFQNSFSVLGSASDTGTGWSTLSPNKNFILSVAVPEPSTSIMGTAASVLIAIYARKRKI